MNVKALNSQSRSGSQSVKQTGPKSKDATPIAKANGIGRRHSVSSRPKTTKTAVITRRLRTKRGASIDELAALTGWQNHSLRGLLSGTLKKKRGLTVTSEKVRGRGRVYRIVSDSIGT